MSHEAFQLYQHLDDLDPESKYLVHKAKETLPHAYAPYSKFLVAAAVLLEDGTYVLGTNQENAAYPSGICAERLAVFAANSQHPTKKIKKVAIVAKKKNHKELAPAASCGACRQVLLEAERRQGAPIQLIMYAKEEQWVVAATAASLLPFTFTNENL
jgi:cytidine deaminase